MLRASLQQLAYLLGQAYIPLVQSNPPGGEAVLSDVERNCKIQLQLLLRPIHIIETQKLRIEIAYSDYNFFMDQWLSVKRYPKGNNKEHKYKNMKVQDPKGRKTKEEEIEAIVMTHTYLTVVVPSSSSSQSHWSSSKVSAFSFFWIFVYPPCPYHTIETRLFWPKEKS